MDAIFLPSFTQPRGSNNFGPSISERLPPDYRDGREGGILGPKLLLAMGCVKASEKNYIHLPSVGEQTTN